MKYDKDTIECLKSELEKMDNTSVACSKCGISRNTLYRWLEEKPELKGEIDRSRKLGRTSICDLAENKIAQMINEGKFRAIKYYLDNNHPSYIRPRHSNNWNRLDEFGLLDVLSKIKVKDKSLDKIEFIITDYSSKDDKENGEDENNIDNNNQYPLSV